MLLISSFLVLALISFVTLAAFLRPRATDTVASRRLKNLLATQGNAPTAAAAELSLSEAIRPGPFSWIDDLLGNTRALHQLRMLLSQAKCTWQAGNVIAATLIAAVLGAAAMYAVTRNLLLGLPVAAALLASPVVWLAWRRRRNIVAFDAVLPDAIDMCARSLRAGHSVVAAIGIVAEESPEPAKSEFGDVFQKQNYGVPMRDALLQMLQRVPSVDLHIVVTAILVQKDTGGNLAEIMDRVVNVIRDRARIQGEVRIHTAQGRFTGWVLCLLPVALLGLINIISPGYSRVLFQPGLGRTLLYTGVALIALGAITIRHIIHGIEV